MKALFKTLGALAIIVLIAIGYQSGLFASVIRFLTAGSQTAATVIEENIPDSPTSTSTATPGPSPTPSNTPTPTATYTPSNTPTPTATPTFTPLPPMATVVVTTPQWSCVPQYHVYLVEENGSNVLTLSPNDLDNDGMLNDYEPIVWGYELDENPGPELMDELSLSTFMELLCDESKKAELESHIVRGDDPQGTVPHVTVTPFAENTPETTPNS